MQISLFTPPLPSSSNKNMTNPNPKTALLIIDVQNDFLPPNGSLAIPQGNEILPILKELVGGEEWMDLWEVVVVTQVSVETWVVCSDFGDG